MGPPKAHKRHQCIALEAKRSCARCLRRETRRAESGHSLPTNTKIAAPDDVDIFGRKPILHGFARLKSLIRNATVDRG
jgi:hypothetical protein